MRALAVLLALILAGCSGYSEPIGEARAHGGQRTHVETRRVVLRGDVGYVELVADVCIDPPKKYNWGPR